jgi:outer membrane lipoprotein
MKKIYFISVIILTALLSCAPVFKREIMDTALIDIPLSSIRQNPDAYKGRVFIIGGLIVSTKITENGSLIEAIYVPVDSLGYLKDIKHANGRFLAILPKEKGLLDPVIYRQGREITVAGKFVEMQTGKIGEMQYAYPFFEIKDIHLWEERKEYYIAPPYYYYYPYPYPYWRHDPWRWHYPYSPPWW